MQDYKSPEPCPKVNSSVCTSLCAPHASLVIIEALHSMWGWSGDIPFRVVERESSTRRMNKDADRIMAKDAKKDSLSDPFT